MKIPIVKTLLERVCECCTSVLNWMETELLSWACIIGPILLTDSGDFPLVQVAGCCVLELKDPSSIHTIPVNF